jgi:hypothetical protein
MYPKHRITQAWLTENVIHCDMLQLQLLCS